MHIKLKNNWFLISLFTLFLISISNNFYQIKLFDKYEVSKKSPDKHLMINGDINEFWREADQIDKDRVAQELALLTVKSDVSEEVDRLHSHVKSAKSLINSGLPSGQKLDFLLQEFNRETNTLCSKAIDIGLTEIGLELKVVIDQLREQVQNVE